jgi:hypothetical protein
VYIEGTTRQILERKIPSTHDAYTVTDRLLAEPGRLGDTCVRKLFNESEKVLFTKRAVDANGQGPGQRRYINDHLQQHDRKGFWALGALCRTLLIS